MSADEPSPCRTASWRKSREGMLFVLAAPRDERTADGGKEVLLPDLLFLGIQVHRIYLPGRFLVSRRLTSAGAHLSPAAVSRRLLNGAVSRP